VCAAVRKKRKKEEEEEGEARLRLHRRDVGAARLLDFGLLALELEEHDDADERDHGNGTDDDPNESAGRETSGGASRAEAGLVHAIFRVAADVGARDTQALVVALEGSLDSGEVRRGPANLGVIVNGLRVRRAALVHARQDGCGEGSRLRDVLLVADFRAVGADLERVLEGALDERDGAKVRDLSDQAAERRAVLRLDRRLEKLELLEDDLVGSAKPLVE